MCFEKRKDAGGNTGWKDMQAQRRSEELNQIITHFTQASSQVWIGRVENKTSWRHVNVSSSERKEAATACALC